MSFFDKLSINLPFGKKTETAEYYFALNIGLNEISATTWGLFGHKIDILGLSATTYEGTEDLLAKVGEVLDRSLGILEVEPQKIIFGVPDFWSQDDDLKEPYLKVLRRILKEYDLQPLAYVTTTNAIAHYLQQLEGVPLTALLLGVGESIEITLVRGGKVMENRTTKRTDHLFEDIEKTLLQFTEVEVLPSKILLYPTKKDEDLNKVRDELMTYPWMQKLPFLHFPKIDIPEEEICLQSVILAAAIELDSDVDLKHSFTAHQKVSADTHHLASEKHPDSTHSYTHSRILSKEDTSLETGDDTDKLRLRPYKKLIQHSQEFAEDRTGFIRGDIKHHLEDVGFEEDQLITPDVPEWQEEKAQLPYQEVVEEEVRGIMGTLKKVTKPLTKFFKGKKLQIKSTYLSSFILVIFALAIIMGAYIYFVKAEVTIFVEPQVITNEAEVVADPKAEKVDLEKKIIPGSTVEISVNGSGKAPVTGQKQIGDPARGQVIIYNMTDAAKSLSQGTVLTGSNNLKLTLNTPVTIASQSSSIGADFVKVTKPGKSDSINVTASSIGPEGNLPAGTDLTVVSFTTSQVIARVDQAFSGGTSKTVSIVTVDDQKRLQAQVVDELRQKAETELQSKLSSDKKIVAEALDIIDGKYNFNKKVNDQASDLSLTATVQFKGTSYSDTDLKTIVSQLVETNVPAGFTLDLKNSETQAEVSKIEKDGKLTFTARFKAKLLPNLNIDDLKKKIRGQSMTGLAVELKNMDNVLGSEVKLIPKLPTQISRLPLLIRNISVIITPK